MINLEELKEKLAKRKEKKEFIRTELKKGEVVGKFKFTTPKEISELKSKIFKTKTIKPRTTKSSGPKTDAEKLLEFKEKEFSRVQKEKEQKFAYKQKMFGRKQVRAVKQREQAKAQRKFSAREMAMQKQMMRQQRKMDVEQLSAQQRAGYEQHDEMPMYPQQPMMEQVPQEQMVDNYGRPIEQQPKKKGGFGEAWRKWQASKKNKPIPKGGMLRPQVVSINRPMNTLGQPSMRQSNPVGNLLAPVGSPLVRDPASLLSPINNKVPWRLYTW